MRERTLCNVVHHIGERTSREMMEKMLLLLAASIPVSSNSTWQTKGNNLAQLASAPRVWFDLSAECTSRFMNLAMMFWDCW
jgi:hypothetical protein